MFYHKLMKQFNVNSDFASEILNPLTFSMFRDCKVFRISGDTMKEMELLLRSTALEDRIAHAIPPFNNIFIELSQPSSAILKTVGFVVNRNFGNFDDNLVKFTICTEYKDGSNGTYLHELNYDLKNKTVFKQPLDDGLVNFNVSDVLDEHALALINILYMINCPNLVEITEKPISKTKQLVNKKKKIKLKEHSEITLKLTKEEKESLRNESGDSNKKKRCHMRRGHFRNLPDKVVWVRPCKVGSGKAIKQTYKIKA